MKEIVATKQIYEKLLQMPELHSEPELDGETLIWNLYHNASVLHVVEALTLTQKLLEQLPLIFPCIGIRWIVKKILICILCMILLSAILCGCTYYPPEGFTEEHHTYEEILAYAKTLDSNAVVLEEYTDSVDEYDWEYREWPAVINGVECHVASKTDWGFNRGN